MDFCTVKNERLVVTKNKKQKKPTPIVLTIMLRYLLHVFNLVLRNIKSILYNYLNC